ncbi:MAG: hypothetical protein WBI82_00770 [Sphaerochaeta sp.]
MKKTIAILLVLVLAGVGLFAVSGTEYSNSVLQLSTLINPINRIGITVTDLTITTYQEFLAQADTTPTPTAIDAGVNAGTAVAYLNVATNNPLGVNVSLVATPLSGTAVNANKIHYIVGCGDATFDTSDSSGTTSVIAAVDIKATTVVRIVTKPINITLTQADYDLAPADTYVGSITFSIVSGA